MAMKHDWWDYWCMEIDRKTGLQCIQTKHPGPVHHYSDEDGCITWGNGLRTEWLWMPSKFSPWPPAEHWETS